MLSKTNDHKNVYYTITYKKQSLFHINPFIPKSKTTKQTPRATQEQNNNNSNKNTNTKHETTTNTHKTYVCCCARIQTQFQIKSIYFETNPPGFGTASPAGEAIVCPYNANSG